MQRTARRAYNPRTGEFSQGMVGSVGTCQRAARRAHTWAQLCAPVERVATRANAVRAAGRPACVQQPQSGLCRLLCHVATSD